jgi:hypothetical protein
VFVSVCVYWSLKEVGTLSLRSHWLSSQFVLSDGNPVAGFERPWKIPHSEGCKYTKRERGGIFVYFDKLQFKTNPHGRRLICILATSSNTLHYSALNTRTVKTNGGPGSSVGIATTGWTVRGSNSRGGEICRTRPDRPWGPPNLMYNGYRVFPGGKMAGAWYWTPIPS